MVADWQIRQAGRSVTSADWQIDRFDMLAGSRDRRMMANRQIRRSDTLAGRSDRQIGRLADFT
eukprot:801220-Prorocentrum_lima.AAC.1